MSDANHRIGMICSRYGCPAISVADTDMGCMCREHADKLMFAIQIPAIPAYDRLPRFIPWELVKAHNRQAIANHGGQTLARLSERGGLCPKELLAVLENKNYYSDIDNMALHDVATRILQIMNQIP